MTVTTKSFLVVAWGAAGAGAVALGDLLHEVRLVWVGFGLMALALSVAASVTYATRYNARQHVHELAHWSDRPLDDEHFTTRPR